MAFKDITIVDIDTEKTLNQKNQRVSKTYLKLSARPPEHWKPRFCEIAGYHPTAAIEGAYLVVDCDSKEIEQHWKLIVGQVQQANINYISHLAETEMNKQRPTTPTDPRMQLEEIRRRLGFD